MAFLSLGSSVRPVKSLAVCLFLFLALCLLWFTTANSAFPAALVPGPGPGQSPVSQPPPNALPPSDSSGTGQGVGGSPILEDIAQDYIDFPLHAPYRNTFGELGRRTRVLRDWVRYLDTLQGSAHSSDHIHLEKVAQSLFPFLSNRPKNPTSTTPLADLRSSVEPGSTGIIIPTGDRTIRYTAHLISQLRSILGSTLPIQVVYAGDVDLSASNRDHLAAIVTNSSGPPLEFLDIYTVFNDSTLQISANPKGGWALKPFAALGTRFEKVIVLDADAVFLQQPEVLLTHPAFKRTGTLLFHDRLLWQHAFQDRHEWWREEIRRPSAQLNKSLVWTEDYAEECDSGVVVLDKGRLEVYMGLLHTCWQNSYEVREEATYTLTYGDKETWWMGLEMAGSAYEMAEHYGGIVGWEEAAEDGTPKVCSFVIAHVDEADALLWYNGGLLKNKLTNATEYEVPTKWMIDADWLKGNSKVDMSCMINGAVRSLTEREHSVLARSIERAREMDKVFFNTW